MESVFISDLKKSDFIVLDLDIYKNSKLDIIREWLLFSEKGLNMWWFAVRILQLSFIEEAGD